MSPSLCCSTDRYHTGKSGFHQDNKQRLVQSTAINNGYYICYHYWYCLWKNSLSTAYLHSTGLFTAQVSKLGITPPPPPHTHTHTPPTPTPTQLWPIIFQEMDSTVISLTHGQTNTVINPLATWPLINSLRT